MFGFIKKLFKKKKIEDYYHIIPMKKLEYGDFRRRFNKFQENGKTYDFETTSIFDQLGTYVFYKKLDEYGDEISVYCIPIQFDRQKNVLYVNKDYTKYVGDTMREEIDNLINKVNKE